MKKEPTKLTAADRLPAGACAEGVAFARGFKTLAKAWENCDRGDWMIWLLRHKNILTKPQAVDVAIKCAERVLVIYEKRNPKDLRPRAAVEAARKWLKEPTEENRNAYAAAADAAYAAAADAAAAAADAAAYAADAAAYAADAAAYAADAERKAQAEIIRRVVGNPFKS